MTHSISIEVHVPDSVDESAITMIGERCSPYDHPHGLETGEAIQWAFTSPQGVTELANLGVRWYAQHQGSTQRKATHA